MQRRALETITLGSGESLPARAIDRVMDACAEPRALCAVNIPLIYDTRSNELAGRDRKEYATRLRAAVDADVRVIHAVLVYLFM